MRKVLKEVQTGKFARQWIEENASGGKSYQQAAEGGHGPSDRESRRELRARMPWLNERARNAIRAATRLHGENAMAPNPDRVLIFDTTLRDGEQSPGCSMTQPEKLRVARALAELGVDVIEAGFPAASRGDWESVECGGPRGTRARSICGLARCNREDIELAARR